MCQCPTPAHMYYASDFSQFQLSEALSIQSAVAGQVVTPRLYPPVLRWMLRTHINSSFPCGAGPFMHYSSTRLQKKESSTCSELKIGDGHSEISPHKHGFWRSAHYKATSWNSLFPTKNTYRTTIHSGGSFCVAIRT